jgi:hypothetical protein
LANEAGDQQAAQQQESIALQICSLLLLGRHLNMSAPVADILAFRVPKSEFACNQAALATPSRFAAANFQLIRFSRNASI